MAAMTPVNPESDGTSPSTVNLSGVAESTDGEREGINMAGGRHGDGDDPEGPDP